MLLLPPLHLLLGHRQDTQSQNLSALSVGDNVSHICCVVFWAQGLECELEGARSVIQALQVQLQKQPLSPTWIRSASNEGNLVTVALGMGWV